MRHPQPKGRAMDRRPLRYRATSRLYTLERLLTRRSLEIAAYPSYPLIRDPDGHGPALAEARLLGSPVADSVRSFVFALSSLETERLHAWRSGIRLYARISGSTRSNAPTPFQWWPKSIHRRFHACSECSLSLVGFSRLYFPAEHVSLPWTHRVSGPFGVDLRVRPGCHRSERGKMRSSNGITDRFRSRLWS